MPVNMLVVQSVVRHDGDGCGDGDAHGCGCGDGRGYGCGDGDAARTHGAYFAHAKQLDGTCKQFESGWDTQYANAMQASQYVGAPSQSNRPGDGDGCGNGELNGWGDA